MRELFSVSGKTVLVTGASRGIGEMIARAFAASGARVYLAARDGERIASLAGELSATGECKAFAVDLTRMEGIEELARQFGAVEPQLDVLVNNAGSLRRAELDSFSEADWDDVMDLNAKSVFFLTRALLPVLRFSAQPSSPSRVINIASVNGIQPPRWDVFSYSASKAACIMLTRHLAKRLAGEHILVNAIAPGPFPTDMMATRLKDGAEAIAAANPLGRMGTAEDIAGCAIFLASRASAWTTGAVLPCDGGAAEV